MPMRGQWANALRERGHSSMEVVTAIMRKLVHLIFGVLKSQQPYDRCRAWPTHAATLAPREREPAEAGEAA